MVFVIAALIVVANLSDDLRRRGAPTDVAPGRSTYSFDLREPDKVDPMFGVYGGWNLSYGWPLMWRQYVLVFSPGPSGVVGWSYSKSRLGANVALWLGMLALPAAACEWFLRRRRPGFHWSLRTMLAAVGAVAAVCGWFTVAHNRSKLQDPVIAANAPVWVERWGPKWLDVVGADHLRRRIVAADLRKPSDPRGGMLGHEQDDARTVSLLERLRRLPEVRYLFMGVDRLTPAMAAALGEMRQLRMLSITVYEQAPEMGARLASALGDMRELRMLNLEWGWQRDDADEQRRIVRESLSAIGKLTSLNSLRLEGEGIATGSLAGLAALPHLRSLHLHQTDVTAAGLAALASLESLEELEIDGDAISVAALDALRAIKRLQSVHLVRVVRPRDDVEVLALDYGDQLWVRRADVKGFRRALDALRRAKPGIVIDGDDGGHRGFLHAWADTRMIPLIPNKYDKIPDFHINSTQYLLSEWKEGKGVFHAPSNTNR